MPLRGKPRTQVRLNPLSCEFMLRFFGGKEMKKNINHRDTETQRHRDTETQRHRDTENIENIEKY